MGQGGESLKNCLSVNYVNGCAVNRNVETGGWNLGKAKNCKFRWLSEPGKKWAEVKEATGKG